MINLIVVSSKDDWPEVIPNAEVVTAQEYLLSADYQKIRRIRVFNLCRSYRYQSIGYYVSLLAEARGHRPNPSVSNIEDFKNSFVFRMLSEELEVEMQKALSHIKSEDFTLSIYFGENLSKRYHKISSILFNSFRSPLLRAHFKIIKNKWVLKNVNPIAYKDVPETHKGFLREACIDFFLKPAPKQRKKTTWRYDLAILYNPQEKTAPSNRRALENFIKAGAKYGVSVQLITKADYARLTMFDALFIRETTNVNHHTFRFSRRAEAEGMVVIDDPSSILKCSNKVFLDEMMRFHKVPQPKTVIVTSKNLERALSEVKFPCVLKQPDSAFSQGVVKAHDEDEYYEKAHTILEKSELLVVQEFIPTDFDWRVGIFDQRPLFVCKYYMARDHWQIRKNSAQNSDSEEGTAEAFLFEDVPPKLIEVALKASKLIGNGLYGVDIKEKNGKFYVMEINDNPNIDHEIEDSVYGQSVYEEIIKVFVKRLDQLKDPSSYVTV